MFEPSMQDSKINRGTVNAWAHGKVNDWATSELGPLQPGQGSSRPVQATGIADPESVCEAWKCRPRVRVCLKIGEPP